MSLDSYEQFVDLLFSLSREVGYKPKNGERTKKASPLISPALYKPGTTRSNSAVVSWGGWAALDIDDYETSAEDAMAVFSGVKHVRYSSASSTPEHPKFRVILPLSRHVAVNEIRHVWYAINKEFNSLGDPQTKDLSRMYYVPAKYPKSYSFIDSFDGEVLNPTDLMSRHSYVAPAQSFLDGLPEHLRDAALKHRMALCKNTGVYWQSVADCPYVNHRMIAEYHSICGTGWYKKMYAIMSSIASRALRDKYPISAREIAALCKEINSVNSITRERYSRRNWELEAARAIEFALKNVAT